MAKKKPRTFRIELETHNKAAVFEIESLSYRELHGQVEEALVAFGFDEPVRWNAYQKRGKKLDLACAGICRPHAQEQEGAE